MFVQKNLKRNKDIEYEKLAAFYPKGGLHINLGWDHFGRAINWDNKIQNKSIALFFRTSELGDMGVQTINKNWTILAKKGKIYI